MHYHHIALNCPLGLLSYSHPTPLPAGTRVLVPFRNKTTVGIVWANDIAPDIDPAKILPVQHAFTEEQPLPDAWRELIAFTARYYHYPIGQTAFTALPKGLKEHKTQPQPEAKRCFRLNAQGLQQTPPPERAHKKRALWQALHSISSTDALKAIHAQAPALIQEWLHAGWLDECPPPLPNIPLSAHTLNAGQAAASAAVQNALGSFQPFLLHGITGSGKTEVYFDIAAKILAAGRQVLLLLSEINLTPQLLQRIKQRFPDTPTAVLHSQTAAGQRSQDYLRALSAQAQLIIGTRLAVFTPMPDLGLIIVDEEHDPSFKQDNELRYHARDLAVWRAKQASCPIMLGSATPSLESWQHTKQGSYRLLTLPQRANPNAKPPHISLIDIRRIKTDNGLSEQAVQLLIDNHKKGGLSLVYLNRRGFAPALFCSDCGHIFGCPNCAAKMVLHQRARQLRCHHCDHRIAVPPSCPECGYQDLSAIGQGTQRVEEHLRHIMPTAAIQRVDRDSISRKNDWADLYQNIAEQRIDVLIGTQMLAKGHDFARLNLVIVLNADGSLYSSDFRAPERLFAELMQVSGRAGRADTPGRVFIQTQLPDHPVLHAVAQQNYPLFADSQLQERELFALPPFAHQAAVRADAPRLQDALDWLNSIKTAIAPHLPDTVSQMGAVPMLMARLAERERAQLFLESPDRKALHRAASLWTQALHHHRSHDIRWHIDIDPQDM